MMLSKTSRAGSVRQGIAAAAGIILGIVLLACAPKGAGQAVSAESPSGTYILNTLVDMESFHVVLRVTNREYGTELLYDTGASDKMKWAVGWDETRDLVIFNSSDIGIYAFEVKNKELIPVEPDTRITGQADKIKLEKYPQ